MDNLSFAMQMILEVLGVWFDNYLKNINQKPLLIN